MPSSTRAWPSGSGCCANQHDLRLAQTSPAHVTNIRGILTFTPHPHPSPFTLHLVNPLPLSYNAARSDDMHPRISLEQAMDNSASDRMKQTWNSLASRNSMHFIATDQAQWEIETFF